MLRLNVFTHPPCEGKCNVIVFTQSSHHNHVLLAFILHGINPCFQHKLYVQSAYLPLDGQVFSYIPMKVGQMMTLQHMDEEHRTLGSGTHAWSNMKTGSLEEIHNQAKLTISDCQFEMKNYCQQHVDNTEATIEAMQLYHPIQLPFTSSQC